MGAVQVQKIGLRRSKRSDISSPNSGSNEVEWGNHPSYSQESGLDCKQETFSGA